MNRGSETLLVRALNHARLGFAPTYVGLRVLGESLRQESEDWIERYIDRQLMRSKSWDSITYTGLKGRSSEGVLEYRAFASLSPVSTLGESRILQLLANEAAFEPHSSSFSYQWPTSGFTASRNFDFYRNGYVSRSLQISSLLTERPRDVVFIGDVKAFYPSIDQKRVLGRLTKRLLKVQDHKMRYEVESFARSLLASVHTGVPVGPDFSHLLGHVAMEGVDEKLSEMFGASYTRYVDDIAIVCTASQAKTVEQKLSIILAEEELELNTSKSDIVEAHAWMSHCPELQNKAHGAQKSVEFSELVNRLVGFVSFHPKKYGQVESLLREQGICLPMTRLSSLANYGRWKYFLASSVRRGFLGLKWASDALWGSPKALVQDFVELRHQLERQLHALLEQPIPENGMHRRWHVQKLRYVGNRLLYLKGGDGLEELLRWLPDLTELDEIRAVLQGLVNRDLDSVLVRPGRVASSFSELHHERENNSFPLRDLLQRNTSTAGSSLTSMLVYGVVEDDGSSVGGYPQPERFIVETMLGRNGKERLLTDLSYSDELQTLMIGASKERISELYWTRFSANEDWGLEALKLGSNFYFSG